MPVGCDPSSSHEACVTSSPTTNVSSRWPNWDMEAASRCASFSGVRPSRRAAKPASTTWILGVLVARALRVVPHMPACA